MQDKGLKLWLHGPRAVKASRGVSPSSRTQIHRAQAVTAKATRGRRGRGEGVQPLPLSHPPSSLHDPLLAEPSWETQCLQGLREWSLQCPLPGIHWIPCHAQIEDESESKRASDQEAKTCVTSQPLILPTEKHYIMRRSWDLVSKMPPFTTWPHASCTNPGTVLEKHHVLIMRGTANSWSWWSEGQARKAWTLGLCRLWGPGVFLNHMADFLSLSNTVCLSRLNLYSHHWYIPISHSPWDALCSNPATLLSSALPKDIFQGLERGEGFYIRKRLAGGGEEG